RLFLDLRGLVILAVHRFADGGLLVPRRNRVHRHTGVVAVPTAMSTRCAGTHLLADAAGHAALVTDTVKPAPGRVHAGGAVRAAPGANGRHEARDQEGHEQRDDDYRTG